MGSFNSKNQWLLIYRDTGRVVTNKDPTFFNLLSYINLATIADILRKPRSALRKQGFVYERVDVDLIVENGKARVSNF